jgi:hypothetical protein
MKKLLFIAFLMPLGLFAQEYTFQDLNLVIEGVETDDDISNDTYIDVTVAEINLSWEIIEMDVPEEWFTTFCFEQCYPPGINSGDGTFYAESSNLVNCHVYPEGVIGDGVVKMQVSDENSSRVDTVTWTVSVTNQVGIEEMLLNESVEIEAIYDLSGRKLNAILNQQIVIVRYKNGLSKKVFILEN